MPPPQSATPPVPHPAESDPLITHHLEHLRVQRRLAERTLAMRDTPEFMALAHEVRDALADGHH